MNYQVKKPFIDRDSLKQFRAGDTFSCSDAARAKMLQDKGYLEAGPEEAAPDPTGTNTSSRAFRYRA